MKLSIRTFRPICSTEICAVIGHARRYLDATSRRSAAPARGMAMLTYLLRRPEGRMPGIHSPRMRMRLSRCSRCHGLVDPIVSVYAILQDAAPALLEDLEHGRPLELPWLSGAVSRMGHEAGVPTPIHRFITTVLGPFAGGRVDHL